MTGIRYFLATLTIFTTSSVEFGYTTTLCGHPSQKRRKNISQPMDAYARTAQILYQGGGY